jgi:hypothetical protein
MISGWDKPLNLRNLEALLFPDSAALPSDAGKAVHQYFKLPHIFQPALTLNQALIATLRTLLRIFLGSILFGIWGAYSMLVWTSIPNLFWRVAAMIPMLALFLVLLGGLMIATTLVLRPLTRRPA